MCGIAGIIDPTLSRDQGEALLGRMLESIRHRGPDNSSTWVDMPVLLGHNRLSIIDLSDAANQPMEYGDLVIVYNGEVYNYLEIKEELIAKGYRFRTTSDTEVILAAYKEWGGDCVKRFVGMWAFAIWDKTNKELFCSRDRFGIKPFYYIHAGDKFYFGSEYKPLKLSPLFDGELNNDQVSRGLQMGSIVYRDETYFDCLKALPEACNLFFEDGKASVRKYWDIDPTSKFEGSYEEKTRRFRELFEDSVKLHMRSDVEVGGFLSGGLDSSSITATIGKNFPAVPFKTFTIFYTGKNQMDERPWVDELVAMYSNLLSFHYSPSDDEVWAAFERVVEAHDVPITSSAPMNCYFVMKLAAEHRLKVILDGQGSDEYLVGYPWSMNRVHPRTLTTSEQAVQAAAYLSYFPFLTLDRTIPFQLEEVQGTRLSQHLYHLIFHTLLPSLLHYGDRISMAFSIECRVPFLDHRLLEFVFSLNDEDKTRDGRTKSLLRDSLGSLLPKSIAGRKEKQPFLGGEMQRWLRGPLKHLLEEDFSQLSMLDQKTMKRVLTEYKSGNEVNALLVWRLAVFNYWFSKQKESRSLRHCA
jgi:asparagine synthase (glutamine-hydrolysing)